MKQLFILACLLVLVTARPGLWIRPDGTYAVVGSASLKCNNLYLGAYGAERTTCGGCICGLDRPIIVRQGETVAVKFDHTLSRITVNNVAMNIPHSVNRFGCESDDVKAFRWRCNGKQTPELVYLYLPPYQCVPSKDTKCSGPRKILSKN